MTPPETPDRQGTEPDKNGAVTSVADGADSADEKAGAPAEQETNGKVDAAAAGTGDRSADDGDNGAPPPWQRATSDVGLGEAKQGNVEKAEAAAPAESTSNGSGAPSGPHHPAAEQGAAGSGVGEKTVSIGGPTAGTTAPKMFDEKTISIPNPLTAKQGDAAARTAVNLGAAAGGARSAGTAPPSALRRPGRGPRRASLQIKRFDPWSVLKLSLVLGVALFFVWLVAVGALYAVLEGMGVWDKLNGTYNELLQGGVDGGATEDLISAGRVFGVAAIIGAVNIVLFSALATVGAFVYNVSADLAGGLEVTLAERE